MHLTGLHVYPVKSMYRLSPDSSAVHPWGLAGDRRWMLADPTGRFVSQRENAALGQIRVRPLPDGALALTAPDGSRIEVAAPAVTTGDPVAEVEVWGTRFRAVEAAKEAHLWIGEHLGDYRLVHLDDPRARPVDPEYGEPGDTVSMADGFPLLLTTTASLERLNELIAAEHPDAHETLPMERFRPNVVVGGPGPRTAGAGSGSARSPSRWSSPAAAAWSPPPTRRAASAAAPSRCAPWPGTTS